MAQSQLVFLCNVLLPLQFARMNSSWNSQILVRKKKSSAELVLNADFSGPAQTIESTQESAFYQALPLSLPTPKILSQVVYRTSAVKHGAKGCIYF